MARRDTEFAVKTKGLGALNRSLGKIDKALKRDAVKHLRETAKDVAGTAGSLAPRGTRPLPRGRTVRLADSYKGAANQRGGSVYSNLPQAPVFEYGGTIAPRGVPITIRKHRVVGFAIQREAPRIEEEIGDLLDRIARRNGFR